MPSTFYVDGPLSLAGVAPPAGDFLFCSCVIFAVACQNGSFSGLQAYLQAVKVRLDASRARVIPSFGIYPVILYYGLADAYTALHGRMRVSTQQIYLARPIAPVRPTKDIQQAALVQARHLSDIIRKCLVYLLVRPVWSIGIAECRRHPDALQPAPWGLFADASFRIGESPSSQLRTVRMFTSICLATYSCESPDSNRHCERISPSRSRKSALLSISSPSNFYMFCTSNAVKFFYRSNQENIKKYFFKKCHGNKWKLWYKKHVKILTVVRKHRRN